MKTIAMMYVTLLPVIFAGVANKFFCKSDFLAWVDEPIDGGLKKSDGRRFLGPNKTWKGFWGMITLTAFFQIIWGLILGIIPHFLSLSLVAAYNNDIFFNLFFGFLLGSAYALCDLPNSFIKRRFNIPAGKEGQGNARWVFIVLDYAVPCVGSIAVIALFSPMTFSYYVGYVFLSGLTAFLLDLLLQVIQTKRKTLP